MSDLSKKITELLSNECKAAPDMTHGLKNIGDGDMKEGMKIMVDFFEENGMRKGALLGATATLAGVGLIVGAKKLYSMKKVHKEKGEKILNGLKQGIESCFNRYNLKSRNIRKLIRRNISRTMELLETIISIQERYGAEAVATA